MTDELQPIPTGKSRRYWYYATSILLAAICLLLAIRQVSWAELGNLLTHVRIEFIIFAVLISLFSYFIRSQRWGVLLSQGKKISRLTMFWVTGIGYLGNTFLPLRAGEVIRSVTLGQKVGISAGFVLATALTERILDSITLVIIGIVIFPFFNQMPGWLFIAMRGMALASGVAVIMVFLTPRFEKPIIKMIQQVIKQAKWKARLEDLVTRFSQGSQAFLNPRRAITFIVMTIFIWLLDGVGTMVGGRALNLEFQLSQALLLIVGLGLSSAIPSTPGYVGVYQFAAVTVLALAGYTPSQAIAYILVAQALNMALVLVWGLVGLWQIGISFSELTQKDLQDPLRNQS